MKSNPNATRYKKRVIKWENVITSAYVIITLFKYFITSNNNLLILIYDLLVDSFLGLIIYHSILTLRKEAN